MKRFLLLYPLYVAGLLYFLFFDNNALAIQLNHFHQKLLIEALALYFEVNAYHIVITPFYHITIDKSCNGVVGLWVFFASIAAHQAQVRQKLLWIAIGYIVMIVANFLRIVFVVYAVKIDPEYFVFAHDTIGNSFLIVVGLVLFALFLKFSRV